MLIVPRGSDREDSWGGLLDLHAGQPGVTGPGLTPTLPLASRVTCGRRLSISRKSYTRRVTTVPGVWGPLESKATGSGGQSWSYFWEDPAHRAYLTGHWGIGEIFNSSIPPMELTFPGHHTLLGRPAFPCRQAPQESRLEPAACPISRVSWQERVEKWSLMSESGCLVRRPVTATSLDTCTGFGRAAHLQPEPFSCGTNAATLQHSVLPFLCCILLSSLLFLWISSGPWFHLLLVWPRTSASGLGHPLAFEICLSTLLSSFCPYSVGELCKARLLGVPVSWRHVVVSMPPNLHDCLAGTVS